jgi:2-polyprenyl-3-methyl-5-hydroxy-6-metoxy-1,4-benzoquinol methylase
MICANRKLTHCVAAALLVVACGKDAPDTTALGGSGSNSGSVNKLDDNEREQARYDQERRPDLIVAAAGIKPGDIIADVGAGSGLLTLHLARAVGAKGKVVATDIDRAVLDLLVARLRKTDAPDVVETRIVGDTPGLEDGRYNVVLLAEVDHYFADRVAWLTAAQKSLAPGGRIVLSNRIHHRAAALDAAKKAGLILRAETTPVPSHFVAVFTAKGGQ